MAIRTSVSYKDALQGKAPIDPLEVRRLEGLWDDAQAREQDKPHQIRFYGPSDVGISLQVSRTMSVGIPAHYFITEAERRDSAYAEGQITVRQRKTGGYDGILNDKGQKMWHKMLSQQPTGVIINATIIPARTGTCIYSSDIVPNIITWNNRKIQGTLYKNISMAGRFVEGESVTTSVIVLIKLDENSASGRVITFSGSVYEFIGPA